MYTKENNYGFAEKVAVLKVSEFSDGIIALIRTVEMSYFSPSGKARLGTTKRYSIYCIDTTESRNTSDSRFNYTSKAEATKYYNSIK